MRRNLKLVVLAGILILSITYLFKSYGSSSSYKTEYNSPKLQLLREIEIHKDYRTKGLNFQSTTRNTIPPSNKVSEQLSIGFPYDPNSEFPKIIWQTWKVGLDHEEFPKKYKDYQSSWDEKNSGYKHFIIPDEQCDALIAELYSVVPDVAKAYAIMPKSILKADFFRYLILFARGGVYSDIDTVALKPIDNWPSLQKEYIGKSINPGLTIGIEADPDREDWAEWYARRIQFCQWTIQSKKGHPMLRELIAKITELTLTREIKNQLKKTLGKDEGGDIMNWTGPGIFTDFVFQYMNLILQSSENIAKKKHEHIIDWKLFTRIEKPVVIDDVMLLQITCFSPGVNQMNAKEVNHEDALIHHRFASSWKGDN
ncbi:OCH1 [Candida pseudojiufengensis]|uniref:OCH1 n=1 Tax=Candida pseudojiufengensis TaxID=497109 RepID=UPI002224F85E|nr:OCH1 [Candida pseudojiufengensis]KAI5961660.1 OCH1 [Candida pseudojiufengensis]